MLHFYFDRDGQPISREEWIALVSDRAVDHRRVAEDHVGPWWVSTVWHGVDHSIGMRDDDSPPMIFEVRVSRAYATEADALAGHAALVEAAGALPCE